MSKKKIPTAEDFLLQTLPTEKHPGEIFGKRWQILQDVMLEFAQLHVSRAIEKIEKELEEYRTWGDVDKIKNCYPLTKIK